MSLKKLQNDQVWDELESIRSKSTAQQEEKDSFETELTTINERQVGMGNQLREGEYACIFTLILTWIGVTKRECQMKESAGLWIFKL